MVGVASTSVLPLSQTSAVGRSTTAATTSTAYVRTTHPSTASSSLFKVGPKPLSKPSHTTTETAPTSRASAKGVLNIRPTPTNSEVCPEQYYLKSEHRYCPQHRPRHKLWGLHHSRC